jgi:hypothetical protein
MIAATPRNENPARNTKDEACGFEKLRANSFAGVGRAQAEGFDESLAQILG